MEKWLLIVETNCKDEKRESEFNDWYDNIHIPDVVNDTPGFKNATRYLIRDPKRSKGKYRAIYEIETNDIQKSMGHMQEMSKGRLPKGQSWSMSCRDEFVKLKMSDTYCLFHWLPLNPTQVLNNEKSR